MRPKSEAADLKSAKLEAMQDLDWRSWYPDPVEQNLTKIYNMDGDRFSTMGPGQKQVNSASNWRLYI
jgi:hypothetical protein